jgi:Tol biopolymer transport system component
MLMAASVMFAQQSDFPTLTGPYLGQTPPGATPEKFAPGIISTGSHEYACCFSSDGNEFYFTRQNKVMVTKNVDGIWTEPAATSFAGDFSFEPFVTPDNQRIYFQTGKVAEGQLLMYTLYADRTENGWSEGKDPGEVFNPMKTMHITMAENGNIYTTDISGGMGSESLGIIRMVNGKYEKLEKMGDPFNKTKNQQHPWIAPDESYMVITNGRPGQDPASVLLCSFKDRNGEWTEPVELDLGMEAGQPCVSPDGRYLFFSSGNPRIGSDIYWVAATCIQALRPKE